MKAFAMPLLAALCLPGVTISADIYPSKPIRLIVPFPPGASNDIFGRLMAQKLAEAFGRQVVVDNRGGASGIIGAEMVARAAPDGYTLLLGGIALLSMNPVLLKSLPYDALKDFAPVSLVATVPSMLVTNTALPVKTVQDLIALAKAKPGALNFGSSGASGPPRLAAELFKAMTGIEMVHVPYSGGGPALTATLSGEVQVFFPSISLALPFVKEGKLRGIAVTSERRSAVLPDYPTVAESGVPGYETTSWYAIVAPAATPKPVIATLNNELVKAVRAADTRKRLIELAADPIGSTPEELTAYNRAEISKWAKVAKAAGIKPE